MGLSEGKLGNYIELRDVRNTKLVYGIERVRGVNTSKELMRTRADLMARDLSKFQIVEPGEFVFNHRTSRNGSKLSIAYNDTDTDVICTEDYVVFRISAYGRKYIVPEWLYLYFNRPEFDRYVITNSWGSSTEFFNWEDMCDINITLPPLSIQRKYVAIYQAMLENQKSYERGLEDLRLICDAYFDKLKKDKNIERNLGIFIERLEIRNYDGILDKENVRGISNKKEFSNTKADVSKTDLTKFLVIPQNAFAYNSRTDGRDMLVLAINRENACVLVTWNYNAFRVKETCLHLLNPEYLYAFFKRPEFDRLVRYMSWGSSQELFSWDSLCDVTIPVPDISVQNSIANINKVYIKRKEINEKLKSQIKSLCPILIKGSLEEGRREPAAAI